MTNPSPRPGWPPRPKRPRGLKPGAWPRCREIVKWCRWGDCECALLAGHTYPDHVCLHGFVKKGGAAE